jgi:hypothetical protein
MAVFSVRAQGSVPVHVRLDLVPKGADSESLINSGVGQTAALDLRLISASAGLTPGAPPALSTVETPVLAPNPVPASASSSNPVGSTPEVGVAVPATPVPTATIPSPIPVSLLVSVSSNLLGTPAAQGVHVAVVGPTVPGGSIALADSTGSLMPGIAYVSSGSFDGDPASATDGRAPAGPTAQEGPVAGTDLSEPQNAVALAAAGDAAALKRADRVVDAVTRLGRWFFQGQGEEQTIPLDTQAVDPTLIAGLSRGGDSDPADPYGEPRSDQIEQAGFGVPLGLVVASAGAYRLRQLAVRWWRRRQAGLRPIDARRHLPYGEGARCLRRRAGDATWVRARSGR